MRAGRRSRPLRALFVGANLAVEASAVDSAQQLCQLGIGKTDVKVGWMAAGAAFPRRLATVGPWWRGE